MDMGKSYSIPTLPLAFDVESKEILRQVNKANRALAELKGVATTIPNEAILINTLTLQEAKESSEIENIVTTQDDLYKAEIDVGKQLITAATKEVLRYRETLQLGFQLVKEEAQLSNKIVKKIQMYLVGNQAGFRSQAGTMLKNGQGETVYTPPQSRDDIERAMANLEAFINRPEMCEIDPLIKMAIIHHQFESIHPFYDGNGRTGRIINVLYLVINRLLDLPILYLSRYITQNESQYYSLIQAIRDKGEENSREWQEWILFILKGVEQTALDTTRLVQGISALMQRHKQTLRPLFGKNYRHELLNNLFYHPYTKIEFMQRDLMVQRKTAAKYLNVMVEAKVLVVVKIGRENYYINRELMELFLNQGFALPRQGGAIESVTDNQPLL
ncbi:MAG: Fic family protein [Bacteroidia bacterium]|jgi:filamentation induced by cAMP protein fic|nr:Fic family protein [Bacteroidia bacterium]MBB1541154.1 Fic family protein [Bacteroidia bacterium]